MIGDVQLGAHTVFGSGYWREPHDPTWTESGVGLASEFGCGEDGHLCGPGWAAVPDSTAVNGVLGYAEAKLGKPFLKIGVGALVKGSCPACGGAGGDESYKFNSPYLFYKPPRWTHHQQSASKLTMEHAAELPTSNGRLGYHLQRSVSLRDGATLTMETRLQNTGTRAFRTPFYSHHFLSLDGQPTGPPLHLNLGLNVSEYTDCLPWAKPLAGYFSALHSHRDEVGVSWLRATRTVRGATRVKAVFAEPDDPSAARYDGGWTARYPELSVRVTQSGPLPLYAYSLYVEERTLSPEPIQMISLAPGASISLTRTVTLRTLGPPQPWQGAVQHAGYAQRGGHHGPV
jgi:hypothetical protein